MKQELELVDFDLAKAMKEKGFDWPVVDYITPVGTGKANTITTYYSDGGIDVSGETESLNYNDKVDWSDLETYGRYFNEEHKEVIYSAPSLALAQQWFREVYNVAIIVNTWVNKTGWKWTYKIFLQNIGTNDGYSGKIYDTHDEALLIALKHAITLI